MRQRYKIIVCRGPECGERRASKELHAAFEREIAARGLAPMVDLGWQSCFGRCTQGPNVLVSEISSGPKPEPRFLFASLPSGRPGRSALYNRCSPADAFEIVEQHVVHGTLVRRLIEPIARTSRPAAADAEPSISSQRPDRRPDGES